MKAPIDYPAVEQHNRRHDDRSGRLYGLLFVIAFMAGSAWCLAT